MTDTQKTFEHWYDAVRYAMKNKLWGKVEVVLSNGEYIIVDKKEK